MANRMSRMVGKLRVLPEMVRKKALTALLGRMVPFVGTAGLDIERMSEEQVVVRLLNRRRVQNHIHTLHAAAVALAAETASGFVVGMNLPDDKLPLMKTLRVDYKKRNQGGLEVTARLSEAQKRLMREEPKGEVTVAVEARDDKGNPSVECEMVWAWVPKKRD